MKRARFEDGLPPEGEEPDSVDTIPLPSPASVAPVIQKQTVLRVTLDKAIKAMKLPDVKSAGFRADCRRYKPTDKATIREWIARYERYLVRPVK